MDLEPNQAYYYTQNSQQLGPVSVEQLIEMAQMGQIQPSDQIWRNGMGNWMPASSYDQLTPYFAQTAVVPPQAAPMNYNSPNLTLPQTQVTKARSTKIECKHCNQRIEIPIEEAGTQAVCPRCQSSLLCPTYDEFPNVESPVPNIQNPPRRQIKKPEPEYTSFVDALQSIAGGKSLLFASVIINLQIWVPFILICFGNGMARGSWTVTIVAMGVATLLQKGISLLWKKGASIITAVLALILELGKISMRIVEIASPDKVKKFVEMLPESFRWIYPIIVWGDLIVAILAAMALVFGFRAASSIDMGRVPSWNKD
ncbi:MAG: DUF4339 domain-containing protein [Verrucomicrobiales bacterium]|nr:DUF4339 domain-containing protein [Verrucomicrobiales bacterium]